MSHKYAAGRHGSILAVDSLLVQSSPPIVGDTESTKEILFRKFLQANSCLLIHFSADQLRDAVIIVVYGFDIADQEAQ